MSEEAFAVPNVEFISDGEGRELVVVDGRPMNWSCQSHGPVLTCYSSGDFPRFAVALVYDFDGVHWRCSVSINGVRPKGDEWIIADEGEVVLKVRPEGILLSFVSSGKFSEGDEWKADESSSDLTGEEILFLWPGGAVLSE